MTFLPVCRCKWPILFVAAVVLCFSVVAGDESNPKARMKRVAEGVWQIGSVRLDQKSRTISFDAAVNMTNGLVEYLLVQTAGKVHESVLKTEADAADIHVAALLLGARGAQTNLTVGEFDTNAIPGEPLVIWATWQNGGSQKRVRGEEWVFNSKTKNPMAEGDWVYNGSQTVNGTFIAHRDGSIVSIISDPLALINNPRPGHHDDEIWFVNTNSIPPLNIPVQVTIEFKKPE